MNRSSLFYKATPFVLLAVGFIALFEPSFTGAQWFKQQFGAQFLLRACVAVLTVYVLLLWGESLRQRGIITGMLEALQDYHKNRAAEAAGKLTAAKIEAVGLLIAALGSADPKIRSSSRGNLARIAGEDLGDDPAAWQQWLGRQQGDGGAS